MRVAIVDLRRVGPYVVLDAAEQCVGNTSCGGDAPFNTGACHPPAGCEGRGGGVLLIDPNHLREYGVVRNQQGDPYASISLPSDSNLEPGGPPLLIWAVFPAPPVGVNALDVSFAEGGPVLTNIPITDAGAPTAAMAGTGVQAHPPPAGFSAPSASSSTQGLTLPEWTLAPQVASNVGSDQESPHRATITLRADVLFAFAKSTLTRTAKATLADLAPRIKARAIGTVHINGYTDSKGTDAINIPLSRARAAAVEAALRPQTSGVHYTSAGFGSADPVAPNTNKDGSDNPAGRAQNRRVTIVVPVKAAANPTPPPGTARPTGSAPAGSSSISYHPTSSGGNPTDTYQVQSKGLTRDGSLSILRLAITCHAANHSLCDTEFDFAGSNNAPPFGKGSGAEMYNSVAGLYLTDPASGDILPPVWDSGSYPVASQLDPGEHDDFTFPVFIYYPPLPAGATSMTLHMPGGKPTMSVAVSG